MFFLCKRSKVCYSKLLLIVIISNFLVCENISSAPLNFEPVTKSLPDGKLINLFISGDEFFNYLHDVNGFPVDKGPDGYFYYLIQDGDNFKPTTIRFETEDPFKIKGLKKVSIPSYVLGKRNLFNSKIEEESKKKGVKPHSKSAGIFNNLVIYIRFFSETGFTVRRTEYETRLNSLTTSSLRYYNKEISYDLLDVVSYSYPGGSTADIWYTDNNSRAYYRPYDSSTNPFGYKNDDERTIREHTLLAEAVKWATTHYELPAGVNFDNNQDGILDNICFIIKGVSDGWGDLLWPHRWVLFSQSVKIGDLDVYGYTFQMENVTVNTLSHEMFHALGAPDLYHYDNELTPVGPWDIMAEGRCHPGAWMKHIYGGWIDEIPEITKSGTYVLKPLTQKDKNAYIIKSPYKNDQFFVVEFRNKTGWYEAFVPASGMIIQRVAPSVYGNASGPPDEIYVFRLNGTISSDGSINSAAFSQITGRTAFSDKTNPKAFLSNGGATGINIRNIKIEGDSMLFTVDIELPVGLVLTPMEDTKISASWNCLSPSDFLVAVSTSAETIKPSSVKNYQPGDTIGSNGFVVQNGPAKTLIQTDLVSDETYFFSVWAITGKAPYTYSASARSSQRTGIYTIHDYPYEEKYDEMNIDLPRGWKANAGKSGWELFHTNDLISRNSLLILNPSNGPDEWIYSPGFLLPENKKYMISFNYRNKTKSVKESLFLGGGWSRSNEDLSQLDLFRSENFDYSEISLFKSVFVSTSIKPYYFGFKTGSSGQGVIIDNFRIEEVPFATVQHSEPDHFYPNPSNGIITIPASGYTEISVFRSDGTRIYQNSIESMRIIDLSFLGKGLFYIRFTTGERTFTSKMIII